MHASVWYNIGFAAVVCVVCAVFVSTSAVTLRDRQEANQLLERQRNVLVAAGLAEADESLSQEAVDERFAGIRPVVIDLRTGAATDIAPDEFDQQAAADDPEQSREAPPNAAQVRRLPDHALVYEIRSDTGMLEQVVLPVSGMGLWSTLYGFIAIDADAVTIRGLTFYQHGETPGLGGEVDNPRWKARWPGRKAYDDEFEPRIQVVKGAAGPPEEDPFRVDGLSGATMTSRGVTNLLQFWLGDDGFKPYLEHLRQEGAA